SAKDMKRFRLDDSEDHVSEDAVANGTKLVPAGSVLLLARGMTLLNDIPICVISRPMTFNQDVKALRPKPGVRNDYLPYLLLGNKDRLLSLVDLAGHGTGRLNTDELRALDVALPPLAEQRAIAHILGTLDDKIELNRRMNETLEAMARALFKSWFVDFDPVRAKMGAAPHPKSLSRGERDFLPSPPGRGAGGEGTKPAIRANAPIPTQFLDFARQLRRQATDAENLLWRLLRGRQIANAKFRRQHSFPPYILDFYCHELKLAVELDGGQHNEEVGRRRDARRDEYLAGHGIRVLRFWNNDVLRETEAVLEAIYAAVVEHSGGVPSPPAPLPGGEGSCGLPQPLADLFPDSFEDSELGEIPRGWTVGRVDDEFDLTMGQSPPGNTYNEAGEGLPFYQGRTDFGFRFPTRRVYCTSPTRFAKAGDTLISVRAPVGDINMASEDCAIGRGVAAARHKTGSRAYTYLFMQDLEEVFARFEAEGTVFGSISKKDFHAIPSVTPPRDVVTNFERLLAPIDNRLEVNDRESRTLAALRDALLPKLISGELRIQHADKFLETVA
ncbi:MAG: DUF559 domain-containing protein, partial [Candidatus Contendobacter sp.]